MCMIFSRYMHYVCVLLIMMLVHINGLGGI
jgi:hypothetical protein